MKIYDILEFLKIRFPLDTACDFDNVGLLVGDGEVNVNNVLIALDCTLETVEKAVKENCQLIITHHPVIFTKLKNVTANSIVYKLVKSGISVISMHTNLDIGDGGVNDCLCNELGLKDITPYTAADGYLLKYGDISPITADVFAEKIKGTLGGRVKYVDGGKMLHKILVCSGSGGDFIDEAVKGNFDALVTADVKHHHFLIAKDNGISLFDAGHFETEDVCIEPLKESLKNQFTDINFLTFHNTNIKYK